MCFQLGIGDHIGEAIGKRGVKDVTFFLFEFEVCVHREVQCVDPAGTDVQHTTWYTPGMIDLLVGRFGD